MFLSNHILNKTYQYLLIALAFLMPLTVFGANLVIVSIVLIWLFSGNYKNKIYSIASQKLMIASITFFVFHVVGLIWTDDLGWGLHIIHKMWYFFLLWPVLNNIVEKNYIKYYIFSFLLAISLTELISYLIWFELIPPFYKASIYNPTPFMSHISYNPILAFSIYLVGYKLLFDSNLLKSRIFIYSFFLLSMSFNMFITGGRAGQVMFFAVLVIIIFQFFNREKFKAILVTLFVVPGIFIAAYSSSPIFNDRVNMAFENVIHYSDNKNTSVGQRITFLINSSEIIKDNPFLGVGTGDFPKEYKKINEINTPNMPNSTNPHNMYLLVAGQLGIVGLIIFLSIFYYQFKYSILSTNHLSKNVGIALPILFLIIMLSDSYLLGHFTTLMYVFFSAFLYKDFD